jgi:hypothetical protein
MSTLDLERIVSKAVYVAALLERALHDEGPWTITWGPHEVEAERIVHDDGVTFSAVFPETCWIAPPEGSMALRCRGEVASVRAVDHPGDVAFAVTWDLAARAAQPAGV